MPEEIIVVTEPYADYRKGSKSAAITKEVSGTRLSVRALAACGINRNSEHPEDQDFICDNYDIQRVTPDFWRINFSFSPKDDADQNNPLATPVTFSWGGGLSSEPIDRDPDGNPMVNAAGDPFDPPTQGDIVELYFDVVRWEPTPFDPQKAVRFMGASNDGDLTIQKSKFLDGQVKCMLAAPESSYTASAKAVPVHYSFRAREDGWDSRRINEGFRCWFNSRGGRNSAGPALMELFRVAGVSDSGAPILGDQIAAPILLDEKGLPIHAKRYVNFLGDYPVENPNPPKGVEYERSPDNAVVFSVYKKNRREKFQDLGL